MKKTITIKLESRTIEISRLPLGRYAEVLRLLKELPKNLGSFAGLEKEQVIEKLPTLLADALPEVLDIMAIATPLTKEQIDELTIDELVEIVIAVVEVNKYQEVYEKLKKALARPTLENSEQTTGTTGSGGQ